MKRKDKYRDIYTLLRAEADRPLPEALTPAAIEALVAEAKPEARPKRKIRTRYFAVAAVFLFVVLSGTLCWRFFGGAPRVERPQETKSAQTEDKADDYLRSAASYAEIESFFLERWQAYRESYRESLWNFGTKSSDAVPESGQYGFGNLNGGAVTEGSGIFNAVTDSAAGGSGAADAQTGAAHGETNTQVAGIEEGDILKNDGAYLYIVRSSGQDASFVDIVDIRDPKAMRSVGRISVPNKDKDGTYRQITDLYVLGDTLAVLSSVYMPEAMGGTSVEARCYAFASGAQKSAVQVYDIADRTAPKLRFSYAVDGALLSSRMNGSVLLLTTNYDVPMYMDKTNLQNACVPCYYTDTQKVRFPLGAVKITEDTQANSYLTVSLLDIGKGSADPKLKAVLGGGSNIYCSGDALLVAQTDYTDTQVREGDTIVHIADTPVTRLFVFELAEQICYKGSASLKGKILNQFSMDAYNGCYRIATTDTEGCRVTVLDKDLQTVGTLAGIAKGESIYAVRFMGDTAYMVTFYQTDPLFVLDLHDPAHPAVAGEVKIPGFSNYLHPYSDTLLIGIGTDGTDTGTNGQLKVSLFDVGDPQKPKEISKIVYDDMYASGSPAQSDHKAYLSIPERGAFVIPVQEYGKYGPHTYASMLTVEDNALRIVQNYTPASGGTDDTDVSFHEITRATYAGNTIFTLSNGQLTAFDRETGEILSALNYPYTYAGQVVNDIQ